MAEFALLLPVLLFIIFGIFAFAHYFFNYFVNASTSREAVRYASTVGDSVNGVPRYKDCDEILAAGVNVGSVIDINVADINVSYDNGPGTGGIGSCPIGGTGPDLTSGQRVVVTVTNTYNSIFPFGMLENITLTSTSARTVLVD